LPGVPGRYQVFGIGQYLRPKRAPRLSPLRSRGGALAFHFGAY